MTAKISKRSLKLHTSPPDSMTGQEASTMPNGSFNVSFWPGRRLVLSCYKGQILVHIREYHVMDGKEYPSRKGVCFTPGRLKVLRERVVDIDAILNQQEVKVSYNVFEEGGPLLYRAHAGNGIDATISQSTTG